MKKLLSIIAAILMLSTLIISCEKDDETSTNSVTIEGTFTVGEKTYTNPTFDLGDPGDHFGYLVNLGIQKEYDAIYIEEAEDVDLGNNTELEYFFQIYSAQVGAAQMNAEFDIYLNQPVKSVGITLASRGVSVNITRIGEEGGYIEGTYEGDFYDESKKGEAPFYLKGKFKVKRIATPLINK